MESQKLELLIDYDQSVGEDDPFELDEEVYQLAERIGWTSVFDEAVELLKDCEKKDKWYLSASVFCWAADDKIQIPFDWQFIVALLYGCLEIYPNFGEQDPGDGENLAWSTAHVLKGVGYLSEWDPMKDPEILDILGTIQWKNT